MTRTVVDCLNTARAAVELAPEHVENWLSLGRFCLLNNQPDEARRSFEQGWAAAADQQRWALYISLGEELVELYQKQGRAREFVMAAQRILHRPGLDDYGLSSEPLMLKLTQYFLATGSLQVASQYGNMALKSSRAMLDRASEGEAHFLLAQVSRRDKQLEQAEQHFRQALEIASELHQAARIANLYGALASLYQHQARWDEAEHMRRQAVKIGKLLKQKAGLASDLSHLGVVQLKQEKLTDARTSLEESLQLYRQLENLRGEADQLANLGIIATLEKDLPEAEQHLQRSWQLYEQLEYAPGSRHVTDLMVNLAQLQRPLMTLQ